MWPQWQANPADTPPIPRDLNWDLWLGPVPDRPYHPDYTNAVFRGWYDFGAGSIADMGHYSLFPLFLTLGINTPAFSAEAYGTTTCAFEGNVAVGVKMMLPSLFRALSDLNSRLRQNFLHLIFSGMMEG